MSTAIPLAPDPPRAEALPRLDSIDLVRGLVMVIMLLDHMRDFTHAGGFFYDPLDASANHTSPLRDALDHPPVRAHVRVPRRPRSRAPASAREAGRGARALSLDPRSLARAPGGHGGAQPHLVQLGPLDARLSPDHLGDRRLDDRARGSGPAADAGGGRDRRGDRARPQSPRPVPGDALCRPPGTAPRPARSTVDAVSSRRALPHPRLPEPHGLRDSIRCCPGRGCSWRGTAQRASMPGPASVGSVRSSAGEPRCSLAFILLRATNLYGDPSHWAPRRRRQDHGDDLPQRVQVPTLRALRPGRPSASPCPSSASSTAAPSRGGLAVPS